MVSKKGMVLKKGMFLRQVKAVQKLKVLMIVRTLKRVKVLQKMTVVKRAKIWKRVWASKWTMVSRRGKVLKRVKGMGVLKRAWKNVWVERLLEPWATMKVWKTAKVLKMAMVVRRGKCVVEIFVVRLLRDLNPHSSNCQTPWLGLLEISQQTNQIMDLFAKKAVTMDFGSQSIGSLMRCLISAFSSSCLSTSSSFLDFLQLFL